MCLFCWLTAKMAQQPTRASDGVHATLQEMFAIEDITHAGNPPKPSFEELYLVQISWCVCMCVCVCVCVL